MPVELGGILREFEEPFMQKYGGRLSPYQRKVYRALMRCQSGELGTVLYACPDCGQRHIANCSCGNRHCPLCQGEKTRRWVETQEGRALPCEYALITFTVPTSLHGILRSHPREAYTAMFEASRDTIIAILGRRLGADLFGMLAVLHTWGSQLQYHPHIHILMPAGGISPDRQKWMANGAGFTFPVVKVASPVWRAKLLKALKDKIGPGVLRQVRERLMDQNFVVHAESVGNGQNAVRYLGRYVNRVAISNSRILKICEGIVHFRYNDKVQQRERTMQLPVLEFIRRFMQHILPKGFVKVRHYGFLHCKSRLDLHAVRGMISDLYNRVRDYLPAALPLQPRKALTCTCGQVMLFVSMYRPTFSKPITILDSA
jgi:hypothetical protein